MTIKPVESKAGIRRVRIAPRIGNFFQHGAGGVWRKRHTAYRRLKTHLNIGVIVKSNKRPALISGSRFQLISDFVHFAIKLVILGIVVMEYGPVLINGNGGEPLQQLISTKAAARPIAD